MTLAEGVQLVTFIILTAGVVLAALGVVLASNIVYSAFLLGGVFISIAGLYLLLNASFVAFAQVLIYVGAVNVLILFAIMLVNKREDFRPLKFNWLRKGLTVLVCGGLFALLSLTVLSTPWAVTATPGASGDEAIYLIGEHFFSDYLLPFELASVLLLMAMIGAIVLARRDFEPEDVMTGATADLQLPERSREELLTGAGKK
ncbi:NADH-quinone oxidoreductase subunit J [Synechococcus elongatus]|uniref:NADH-quinone oxidoreductase subunit J n=1 Tax=Synechococcus elongatus TaxID=32046 RepID=UPI0030D0C3C2